MSAAGLSPQLQDRIVATHEKGTALLAHHGCADIEHVEVAIAVERHRWAWRPATPRFVLLAESHVRTSLDDLNISIVSRRLPPAARRCPDTFVRLVYCLGYGENDLLERLPSTKNSGTPQFWNIFGKVAGTGRQPTKGKSTSTERLMWKVDTLCTLRERGIWLLDSLVQAACQPRGSRLPSDVMPELHRIWWNGHVHHTIRECGPVPVWCIGKGVFDRLKTIGYRANGWIYQPNAMVTVQERLVREQLLESAIARL